MRLVPTLLLLTAASMPLSLMAQMPAPRVQNAPVALPPEVARAGEQVYIESCAKCHDHPDSHIPPRARLIAGRSPDYMLRVLNVGVMRPMTLQLSDEQRRNVVAYLVGREPGTTAELDLNANKCRRAAAPLTLDGSSWNGWGGSGSANLRHQPDPGLKAEDVPRLKLKWSFAYPGDAFAPPTLIGGRVFVPSIAGIVFALDADTGCSYWAVDVSAPVRTAITVGKLPSGKFAVYFGDWKGNVHALNADTGAELWHTQIEDHQTARLTGAPVLYAGRLYAPVSSFEEGFSRDPMYVCCTFRGSLVALDATTGRRLWKTRTIDEKPKLLADGRRLGPAGAAIWSAPTIDPKRQLAYAGTGNSYTEVPVAGANAVIAFDLKTGAKRWVSQIHANDSFVNGCAGATAHINCPQGVPLGPDFDIGSSPLLVKLPDGKDRLIVMSKSGEVFGVDVDQRGKVLWQTRVGRGGTLGGIEWGGASDGERIYVTVSDTGSPPPRRAGEPDVPAMPGLAALSPATGEILWRTPAPVPDCTFPQCAATQTSAPIVMPGVVFAGSWDGRERAYSATDGKILWEFNTARRFEGVNGAAAEGGSIDQGAQTIAGGRLFVNSGARSAAPGNALLVFTVDGK